MLKVGKRTIKTFIALILTLSLYLLLYLLNIALGFNEQPSYYVANRSLWYVPTNFYTPFFAGIATVYAMHPSKASSKKQAELRSVGSIIGGYFGYLIFLCFDFFAIKLFKIELGSIAYYILLYSFVSIGVIPLIKLVVVFKKEYSTFIACLTYLSVTISVRNGGMEPFLFATNRILSTIIGVLISLYINTFPHFLHRNKNILFISALDDCLFDYDNHISKKVLYRLEDLNEEPLKLTYMTSRTFPLVSNRFKNVDLVYPIIVMNGAAIYDPKTKLYTDIIQIDHDLREPIEMLFEKMQVNAFSYVIKEDDLDCYYTSIEEKGSLDYHNDYHKSSCTLVEAIVPKRLDVALYVVVNKTEIINELVSKLNEFSNINAFCFPYKNLEGYSVLRITNKKVSKLNAIISLKEKLNFDYVVSFLGRTTDLSVLEISDLSISLTKASVSVKEKCDLNLLTNDSYEIIRLVEKIYHKKNYKEYIKKLKEEQKKPCL